MPRESIGFLIAFFGFFKLTIIVIKERKVCCSFLVTRKMSVSGSRRSTRIAPNRQNRIKNSKMISRKWKMYDYI